MKIVILLLVIAILIISGLFLLAVYSRTMEAPVLVDGQLSACPRKTNCINTENSNSKDTNNRPVTLPDPVNNASALKILKEIIREQGGEITSEKKDYLSSTFSSPFFGFVDDFEIRIDKGSKTIHLRSASRVGRSDFGANSKRINVIKREFINKTK